MNDLTIKMTGEDRARIILSRVAEKAGLTADQVVAAQCPASKAARKVAAWSCIKRKIPGDDVRAVFRMGAKTLSALKVEMPRVEAELAASDDIAASNAMADLALKEAERFRRVNNPGAGPVKELGRAGRPMSPQAMAALQHLQCCSSATSKALAEVIGCDVRKAGHVLCNLQTAGYVRRDSLEVWPGRSVVVYALTGKEWPRNG